MLGLPFGLPLGFGSGFVLRDTAVGFLPRFFGPSVSPVLSTTALDTVSGVSPVEPMLLPFCVFSMFFSTFVSDWVFSISWYY